MYKISNNGTRATPLMAFSGVFIINFGQIPPILLLSRLLIAEKAFLLTSGS